MRLRSLRRVVDDSRPTALRSSRLGGPRLRLLLLSLVFSFSWAPLVDAAAPPILYHAATGNPGAPLIHGLVSGIQTLELRLAIGSVATNTANQSICTDGDGDEICGLTVALQGSGGVSIVDFCPGNNCASGLVHHLDPATGILRINRLGPEIVRADTPFHLGRITVNALGEAGDLRVLSSSQAVSAKLEILSVRDRSPLAVWLPEPNLVTALALGVAGLAAGARARALVRAGRPRRRSCVRRPGLVALALPVVACASLGAPRLAGAQQFSDLNAFTAAVSALGSPPERLGFETIPLTPAGHAALQQGEQVGPVTLRSLSLSTDVDLAFMAGVPLGLIGTLLVADPSLGGDPALHPGGTAQGAGARGDDDVRIGFDVPMRAAGLRILGNVTAAGETVRFLDAKGVVVTSFVLPGGAAAPGGNGFVGYLIQPGDAPIAAIEVDEDGADGDDIAVDELLFESTADSFADSVALFAPTVFGGEPTAPNLDGTRSLGRPDGQTVSLGRGGKLVVRFDDNVLSGSGDDRPDLRIFEANDVLEETLIQVSANGVDFTSVGQLDGGTQTIDLDAHGFGPSDRLRHVQIIDDGSHGPNAGPSVGADVDAVEALSGGWTPPDLDDDHVADAYDVCPSDYDAAQRDDDADGVGNACDNCPFVSNPGQGDSQPNGIGDKCEPARVELVREFPPVPSFGMARLADLQIDCGGFDVYALTLGIWVPPGPMEFDFGGCQAPQIDDAPAGAPHGGGCPASSPLLGARVQGDESGAFGDPVGDPMIVASRSDVVFVTLRGSAANGGKLCSAFETDVQLGELRASLPLGLAPGAAASISLEDALRRSWCLVEDENGCRDQTVLAYAMTSGIDSVAEIRLQPAAGETATSPTAWDVCVAESTETFMHRITLGLLGPVDADYDSLFLDDCLVGPNASGTRTCDGEIGVDPDGVDESVSFTRGPLTASASPLLAATLYTPLDGATAGTGGVDVLNPYIGSDACIGVVTNDAPPATLGAPPIPIRDGFSALAYHDAGIVGAQPYQTAIGVAIEGLDGAAVYETIVFNSGDDLDGDGVTDPVDNCPFAANAGQRDDGGFATTVSNSIGNACECGDANGSGRIFAATTPETGSNGTPLVPDLQRIREYLVGMHATDPDLPALCSVAGDTDCDAADAVVLDRALQGLTPAPQQRCASAVD